MCDYSGFRNPLFTFSILLDFYGAYGAASGNFTKKQQQSVAPDDLLLSVYEKYESLAGSKGISLQFSLPDSSYQNCTLDIERITQVLSILMDNALSYTPQSGKILVQDPCDCTWIREVFPQDNGVVFTVVLRG